LDYHILTLFSAQVVSRYDSVSLFCALYRDSLNSWKRAMVFHLIDQRRLAINNEGDRRKISQIEDADENHSQQDI
jgi:hypothetical protein